MRYDKKEQTCRCHYFISRKNFLAFKFQVKKSKIIKNQKLELEKFSKS